MQVHPWPSTGLRIPCCHNYGLSCSCGLDLIPRLGTPCAAGWQKKKKKNDYKEVPTPVAKWNCILCFKHSNSKMLTCTWSQIKGSL